MDDNKESTVTYYPVPTNVTTKFEFFPGFGWSEFKWLVLAVAIGGALFFLSGLIKTTSFIDPNDLTLEQSIGLDKEQLVYNEAGMIEVKKEAIPMIIRVILVAVPVSATFLAVRREPSSNMSLISMLKGLMDFNKRQKRFMYRYNSASEV